MTLQLHVAISTRDEILILRTGEFFVCSLKDKDSDFTSMFQMDR